MRPNRILSFSFYLGKNIHLEQLHPNTGKHKLQQGGNKHNIANGLDGHKNTLDDMLGRKREKHWLDY